MRKKWMAAGIVTCVGAAMLLSTAFAAPDGGSGYELYKETLKNMKNVGSVTGNVTMSVSDNGEKLLQVDTLFKADHQKQAASSEVRFEAGGQEHAVNVFRQDGRTVLQPADSDTLRVIERDPPRWAKEEHSPAFDKGIEKVIDALAAPLKDQIDTADTPDGGKLLTLHLSSEEIPAVVNAIAPFVVRRATDPELHAAHGTAHRWEGPAPQLDVPLPALKEDIRIEDVRLEAAIGVSGRIERQSAAIVLTGLDADGTGHELQLQMNLDLSGFGQTVPDSIDLAGRKMETIRMDGSFHRGPWGSFN